MPITITREPLDDETKQQRAKELAAMVREDSMRLQFDTASLLRENMYRNFNPPITLQEIKERISKEQTAAQAFRDLLIQRVNRIYNELKSDQEMVVCYYSPAGEEIQVKRLGYQNPSIIEIEGLGHDGSIRFIPCHMAAVELVVKITPKQKDEETKRIGFQPN